MPIGSLYQYFPDKPAILRELARRTMTRVHAHIAVTLSDVRCKADALAQIDALLDGYYALFKAEPDTRDIWAATQSDKELQELDLDDSRSNAALIAAALSPLVATEHLHRIADVSLLLTHLAGAACRLALAVGPDPGDRVMAEFRLAVRQQLEGLLADK